MSKPKTEVNFCEMPTLPSALRKLWKLLTGTPSVAIVVRSRFSLPEATSFRACASDTAS